MSLILCNFLKNAFLLLDVTFILAYIDFYNVAYLEDLLIETYVFTQKECLEVWLYWFGGGDL